MAVTIERDPVCGMDVDPEMAKSKLEQFGKTYYFCSPGCAQKFTQQPEKYIAARQAQVAATKSSLSMMPATAPNQVPVGLSILPPGQKERDPVCGMTVDPKKAAGKFEHQRKTYSFCSAR